MGKVRRRGNKFVIDYYADGRRYRETIAADRKLAEQILAKRTVEIVEGRFLHKRPQKQITFEQFSDVYLNTHARPQKKSWINDELYLKELKPILGKKILHTIKTEEIERFKAEQIKTLAPATVNRKLALLKTMFNKAIEWGYTDLNPAKRVKLFRENNQRARYLMPDEFQHLLSFCNHRLKRYISLAVATGLRKGEMQKLKPEDVDLKRGLIRIKEQKNGRTGFIPINETAARVLADGLDFDYNPRKAFEQACKNAKIKDFRFHDLRHTFCSWLVMAGVPIYTVMRLARHKDIKMTERYAHLAPDYEHASIRVIDGHNLVTNLPSQKLISRKSL